MIKLPNRYMSRKLTLSSLARITNSTKDHAIAAQVAEQNFVDGRRCIPTDHKNSQTVDNINPATGKVIGQLYHSGKEEVNRSIKNSKEAFASWSSTSASERSSILRRAGKRIRENIHEIAKLETLDSGKTISESTFDVEAVVECCNYFSSLCYTLEGQHVPISNEAFAYTIREPLGVCGGIGAWNFPFSNIAWKTLPAIACGNTALYKPSPLTPLTSTLFAEILVQVGLPPGVLNIVQGGAVVGEALCTHPDIAKVSFTGSVETGAKVMAACAPRVKPVTLELGGKSPLIIFEDADMENAVQGALMANFITQGEVCSNAARVYVHESIFDEFKEKVVHATKNLCVEDTFNSRAVIGALISKEHLERVEGFIQRAVREGARILCGGDRPNFQGQNKDGYYLNPCVMDNCHDGMEIIKEEHFGPIMCVLKFSDEEEAMNRANNTRFGLSGGVFTRDISRAHRVIKNLQAGTCSINTYNMYPVQIPFGGNKMSGFGRENGTAVLNHYTQIKTVYVETGDVESMFR